MEFGSRTLHKLSISSEIQNLPLARTSPQLPVITSEITPEYHFNGYLELFLRLLIVGGMAVSCYPLLLMFLS